MKRLQLGSSYIRSNGWARPFVDTTAFGFHTHIGIISHPHERRFEATHSGVSSGIASRATIKIYLADGTPEGLRLVQESKRIAHTLVCPTARFSAVRVRRDLGRPGV